MSNWLVSWLDHDLASPRTYAAVWGLSLVVALSGSVAVGLLPEARSTGYALLAAGGGGLAALSLYVETQTTLARATGRRLRGAVVAGGGLAFFVAVAFVAGVLPATDPLAARLVVLATGFQALLLGVDIRAVRRSRRARATVLLASHGAIFAGSYFTLAWGQTVPRAGLLLYAGGFASLLVTAFWARTHLSRTVPPEPETPRGRWEALLCCAVVVGTLGAVAMALGTRTGTLTLRTPVDGVSATVTAAAAVVAFATLGAPRSAPEALRWLDGPVATVVEHVLVLFVVVNATLLGVFVAAPWLLPPVFGVFVAALLVSVALNYAMLVHAGRRGHDDTRGLDDPGTDLADAGVTVVVTAANEVDALSGSLRENVAALAPLPFLLVPAVRSTDGTQDLMRAVRDDHPDRVRVVEGTSGSKAADLNQVWDHVETSHVLILDADETVTPAFIARALRVLSARPDVGIVQGRKLAADPDASWLSQFVSAERQHSTWLDHPFDADVLAAGHFAGSAAVLRRPVLPAVDGFDASVLTEDIDLTVRLYLETEWDVAYVPQMVARELLPGTWTSLLRQRERWARGWAQVAGRHLGDVLGSWRRLGPRRSLGLSWVLLLAVSAPFYTVFPALALPTVALDVSLGLSLPVVVAVAAFLLPERAVSFAVAVFRDPAHPTSATPRRVVTTVAGAYLWVGFGWVVQLHSLYLQLAGAPPTWTVTRKTRGVPALDRRVAAGGS